MRNQFIGSIRTIWQAVLVIGLVLGWYCPASAQPDILPSSVDVRLVQGNGSDELLVQIKANSTAPFGGIFSALTVTIRYDASSGASLGAGTSFCNAWSAFTPSPVVVNNGTAYRTYNGFGLNRMEDPPFDGGCGLSIPAGTWFTITTIPVTGSCTGFILGNDAYTQVENRDYYISMGGYNVTGQVLSGSVNGGNCDPDCLGEPGGAALPGTACDDNDPGTSNDTWGADCVCAGTPVCEPPVIDQTTSNSPICSNATLNLGVSATGTAPLTYAWTGMGTFSPDAASPSVSISGAATGNYEIEVSNACGSVSAIVPVTVTSAPSAAITYPGSPYCSNGGTATVTRTGTAGGAYSASPVGLSINASTGTVNLGSSTPGSYTVTYTIAASGGCASFSTTANVAVTSAPSAAITYPGSPYCSNGGTATVARTGTAGGAYSASPAGLSINASTGAVNLGSSTPGSYTVTYTIAASGGCASFSTTANVAVTSAPSAAITYPGSPYCSNGGTATVARTGTAGGAYSASPAGLSINASTGAVNLGSSTPGSYTVTYTIAASGGCASFSTTANVTVTSAPSATITYPGSPYCSNGGTATVTRTGTAGGAYSASPAGLSINASTGAINLATSSGGSYVVSYTIMASGGCPEVVVTAPVELQEAPVASIEYDGSPYCISGSGSASVTLTGTGGGVFTSAPTGLSLDSSTGLVDLDASIGGTYTVTYTLDAVGVCPGFVATTQIVLGTAPAATISYSGSPYCSVQTQATVTRNGSAGGTYSAVPAGLSINPTTGAINPSISSPGSYTVTYTIAAAGGCSAFTTTALVEVETATVWYADNDNDGAGDPLASIQACDQPPGYVVVAGDGCPTDPGKTEPGVCGCGSPDLDSDMDGVLDCLDNCPNQPGQIGDACDDGNANTADDVVTADCVCVGTVIWDCPSLEANIGDACDDGNANTADDVVTADCACVGTVIWDCPALEANIGDACDDGNANTADDVVTADCACVGTVIWDCPSLEANIGDACDDGNANTADDVVTADCVCVGSVIWDCPSMEANIGDACDDGNANTADDVVTADCACVGTVIWDCPALEANIGDTCDDGNANTADDVVTADCACVGTVIWDCPALEANIGDACDDGNANTADDVVTADCACVGTVIWDCPSLEANIGDACDDGNANTADDMVTADCVCVGTVIWDCPSLEANIGDACDDGNANTADDVVTADCACVGTVIWDCPALEANIGDACDDGNEATLDDVITEECVCEGVIPDAIGGVAGNTSLTMSIFPNPSRSGPVLVHIEGLPQDRTSVLVLVLDASGRKVHQDSVHVVKGTVDHRLDLTRASRGVYVVEVLFSEGRLLGRLILQ